MRWTFATAAAALVFTLAPAPEASAMFCMTGGGPYTGCTWAFVLPGYCWVGSAGQVNGTPYSYSYSCS